MTRRRHQRDPGTSQMLSQRQLRVGELVADQFADAKLPLRAAGGLIAMMLVTCHGPLVLAYSLCVTPESNRAVTLNHN